MRTLVVRTSSREYPVHVGRGLLRRLPEILSRHARGPKAVVVSDAFGFAGPARAAAGALARAGWDVRRFALPAGEKAKTLPCLERLYSFLLRSGAERRTPVIAVGGGSIGDAAGFAAATYYRGVPLVHVPTTLLAQVDSALGGKTGLDHPRAKNAIGAFYQPLFVLADPSVLATLPERQYLAGFGEVVKYALVFDPPFARRLLSRWERLMARDPAELDVAVSASLAWKGRIVSADELDLGGVRELLNFGHTLGHALESATGYRRFLHGEAVSWGMRFAVELSGARGWLKADRSLADSLLARLPAPPWPRGLGLDRLAQAMKSDKKVRGGRNVFVLLRRVGRAARVEDVSRAEMAAALGRLGSRP